MLKYILIQLFILLLVFLLPNSTWSQILIGLNSLKPKKKSDELIHEIEQIETFLLQGQVFIPELKSRYKFYSSLLEQLCFITKQTGGPLRPMLMNLKSSISKDVIFESKINRVSIEGYLQLFIAALIVWGFSWFTEAMIQVNLSMKIYFSIGFLQLFGMLSLYFCSQKMKTQYFNAYEKWLESLTIFQMLAHVSLSIGEKLSLSEIERTFHFGHSQKLLSGPIEKFQQLLFQHQKHGAPLSQDLHIIVNESWQILDLRFDQYLKMFNFLKFFHLVLFGLLPYLVFVMGLFQFFMAQ